MAFCPQCGSPVEPSQQFCDNCGASLSDLHENMTQCRQIHGEQQRRASSMEQETQKQPAAFSPPAPPPLPVSPPPPPPLPPVPPVAAGFVFTPRIILGIVAAIIIIAVVIFFILPGGSSSARSTGGAGASGGSGLSAPGTMTQCPALLFLCNGFCVDLRTDTGNCGACGVAVPSGKTCQNGQLVSGSGSSPGAGYSLASPSPTTLPVITSPPQTPPSTSAPAPAPACPPGQTLCNGACRNMQYDNINCGACGVICPQGQSCQYGQCTPPATPVTTAVTTAVTTVPLPTDSPCAKGEIRCNGACKNLMTDPANCAVCGRTCAVGEKCQNGQCGPMCTTGTTYCNGVCINLKTDMNNCGACDHACPSIIINGLGSCQSGQCKAVCNAGYGDCDNSFVTGCEINLKTNNNYCGSCSTRCTYPYSCINGYCLIPK